MNISDLLTQARQLLASECECRLEAEVLLCHALNTTRAWLYAHPAREIDTRQAEAFLQLVRRRRGGEPVAYITGFREFWSLRLQVTPDVLIPRPETELLVETALAHIPVDSNCRIADLGTGSGAVALAIASERPRCDIHATDISHAALAVARNNALSLAIENVHFHHGSWLSGLTGTFDCIVSNPPYVSSDDPHLASGDCRHEPSAALSPGADAMTAIRQLAAAAWSRLEPGGILAFEHGFEQGKVCRELLLDLAYDEVDTIRDLTGHERVTSGKRTNSG